MINYILNLRKEFVELKNKIDIEEDKYKVIDLEVKIMNLEYRINYCINLVINNFSQESLLDITDKYLPDEKKLKALEEATNYNEIVLKNTIDQINRQKEEANKRINAILSRKPDAEDEKYKGTFEHDKIKLLRRDLIGLDKYITKIMKKSFVDFLSFDEKQLLVEKILLELSNGNETKEELLKKATEYKSPLDLLKNPTYPLAKRFIELTKDKNDSLSKYLLENEEHIKRLTIVSNHDAVSAYFDQKVLKVEHQFVSDRHEEFKEIVEEEKIDDITNSLAQFNSKIYYSQEKYDRFASYINELQTTTETKEKIKKLLKKFDSLNIIDEHADAGESQQKEYGFIRFVYARKAFVDAMNEDPANEEKIKNALENLKNEEAKIVTMYKLIEEELGDDYHTMPSNVDSFRTQIIPPCFKNNLVLNAKFNSLFIMLTFIKEKKIDIDDFVENPITLSRKCIEESFQKCNLDDFLMNKSKAEALMLLADGSSLPKAEDPVKFTRCFELIYKTERNKEFKKKNHLSWVAVSTYVGDVNRGSNIASIYFDCRPLETIQNVLLAKKNPEGKIPYFDCYISPALIQDDAKTGIVYDEKPTIVEQIKNDENIEMTFYEAINTLKDFTLSFNNVKNKQLVLEPQDLYAAVQELAFKIIVTLNLKRTRSDQKRGYSERFVNDLFLVINDYKQIEDLSGFEFETDDSRLNSMVNVYENKKSMIKTYEKNMNNRQKIKEELFISEFERINKEIDTLDKRADELSEKLEKGATSKEIEEIALEQHKKFIELRKLQNNRIKELKEDLRNGLITKFYFEKRCEQVKLLTNIKDKPAMFMCDDKNYKDFKAYAKNVLNIEIKKLNANDLRVQQDNYNLMMQKIIEEKRLYLINNILKENGLGINKSINYEKVEEIVINDNLEEMKDISNELLLQNQKIKDESYRTNMVVNMEQQKEPINDKEIQEEVEIEKELI